MGRDLFVDLDGDHKPDLHFVHTAWACTLPDGKQERYHLLRSFDMNGVFHKEHYYAALGTPVVIPSELDEATHKPDLRKEWPTTRAHPVSRELWRLYREKDSNHPYAGRFVITGDELRRLVQIALELRSRSRP